MLENIQIKRAIDADGIDAASVIRAKDITVENCLGTVAVGLFSIGSTVDIDSARITGIHVRSSARFTNIRNAIVSNNGYGGGIWCSNASLIELITRQ